MTEMDVSDEMIEENGGTGHTVPTPNKMGKGQKNN
jgi:hypothetical protein